MNERYFEVCLLEGGTILKENKQALYSNMINEVTEQNVYKLNN